MSDCAIKLHELSTGYRSNILVENLSLKVARGGLLNILGPNGVGKTTLLKALTGLNRPICGDVFLFGQEMQTMCIPQRGKKIALVSQSEASTFALTVLDTVLTGRAAHIGLFGKPAKIDQEIAMAMLDEMGIADLADQDMPSLSGGQKQMVRFARALAQKAPIVVLDEPTSHLDIANQMQVLRAIKRMQKRGITIVMTTHDPEHAFACGGDLLALRNGAKPIYGKTESVLDEALIESLFSVPMLRHVNQDGDFLIAPRYKEILKEINA
jgi:iron complex transport system ATP-binding protein